MGSPSLKFACFSTGVVGDEKELLPLLVGICFAPQFNLRCGVGNPEVSKGWKRQRPLFVSREPQPVSVHDVGSHHCTK